MNLPNKLTMFRVVLIPFFVIFLLVPPLQGPAGTLIALILFIVASLTDLLDGKIARKYNLVTNFGKFMDPLADKLLVCSAMICMVKLNKLAAWIVIIIMAREFIISGFRLIAADQQIVIAANMWGKVKTVFQMAMIILLLIDIPGLPSVLNTGLFVLTQAVVCITLILTVVSLMEYLIKNKEVMRTQKKIPTEEKLAELLRLHNLTITTAESCTGGLIAGTLTNVAGISSYFKEGSVTYSNEAKEKYLDVKPETLRRYGAVSEQTAREMVTGILCASGADTAVAVTGIAGPDGGTPEKSVGLVYIGYGMGEEIRVKECHFEGNRSQIRQQTVETALQLVYGLIKEKKA